MQRPEFFPIQTSIDPSFGHFIVDAAPLSAPMMRYATPTFDLQDSSEHLDRNDGKRRTRSFTSMDQPFSVEDLSQWNGAQGNIPLPQQPIVNSNGKVLIGRPQFLTSKPVHIISKHEKKLAHSAMERRYRKELNLQINQLRQLVPACEDTSGNLNKVAVLKKATEFIKFLKQQEQLENLKETTVTTNESPTDVRVPQFKEEHPSALEEKIKQQQELIEHQQQEIHRLNQQLIQTSQYRRQFMQNLMTKDQQDQRSPLTKDSPPARPVVSALNPSSSTSQPACGPQDGSFDVDRFIADTENLDSFMKSIQSNPLDGMQSREGL